MKKLFCFFGLFFAFSSLLCAGPEEKIQPCLRELCHRLEQHTVAPAGPGMSAYSSTLTRVDHQGFIQVYVYLKTVDEAALAALREKGCRTEIVNRQFRIVQGWVPFTRLGELAALEGVRRIRAPAYARPRTGSVNTEGDAILKADRVRGLGFNGSGVKVGVISDGITARQSAIDSGDLPANIEIGNAGFGNEGVAMLEIIHDLAPGAALAFSSGNTSLEFIASITQLRGFGCQVIVDDLGFPTEPFFEDGPVAQAAQAAVDAGVFFCSSAGNSADDHYEGDFAGLGPVLIGGQAIANAHNFGGGDFRMRVIIPANNTFEADLQWSNPFGSSSDNYNIYLFRSDNVLLASSTDIQNGNDDPVETLTFGPSGVNTTADLVIEKLSGADQHLELVVFNGNLQEFVVAGGSVLGHPAAAGVFAVGAISSTDPGHDTIQDFSSQGPAQIFFPARIDRNKPQACGIDTVTVTGAGGFGVPFVGTSAASPHIAAVAALLLSKNRTLTPAQITALLQDNAVDLGAAGFDFAFGSGRVDALAAVNATTANSGAGGGGGGGRCFIATAAYGTPAAADVLIFRQFRDQRLEPSAPGHAFIETYYANSPLWARQLARRPALKALLRGLLRPAGRGLSPFITPGEENRSIRPGD